jgi:uncharacterized protein YukE
MFHKKRVASDEAVDEIARMLERAGDAAGRAEHYRQETGLWAGVMTMSDPDDGSRAGFAPAVEARDGVQLMLTADQHVLVQEPTGEVHAKDDGIPPGWDVKDHLFETSTEAMIALGQWLDVLKLSSPAAEAATSPEDEPGDELGSDEEFEAEMRPIEAKARSDKERILALLADTGVTEDQLDQLGWEYLDAGHSDMSPDGPYLAWIRERLARGPIMDDGGAAEGRVRARWEFAALSEEEQRRQLDRALAEMHAAVKEERAEDARAALATCWLMVEARRSTWERELAIEYESTARSEGRAAGVVSDFVDALGHHLDEIRSALERDEELLPDDVVYRTFTLTENLASLVARHLRQRDTRDVLDLLEILPGALLSLSKQTPSGRSVPNLDLERTDD